MKRAGCSTAIAALGVALLGGLGVVQAATTRFETVHFNLFPASNTIATCLPQARAEVTVLLATSILGFDIFRLQASGLPPDTDFAVFLTESSAFDTPPFGAVEYIGDFTTDAEGHGSVTIHAIIQEAFSSTLVDGQRVRKDLNNVIFWFADPAADDVCFGPGGGPITPFDGDGEAGAAAMSTKEAPLPAP